MDSNDSTLATLLSFSAGDSTLNRGRRLAYESFAATLNELFGRSDVSEVDFRDAWLDRLREHGDISRNGWYEPPPQGMAVLSATDEAPGRISFESLRLDAMWPSATTIDWERGILYAYCSPVDFRSRLPGDFAVTLYFGNSSPVREHFRNAHAATRTVLQHLVAERSAAALFIHSEEVFASFGLRNSVVSVTDSVVLDLGHSLPRLRTKDLNGVLGGPSRDQIRHDRRFISRSSDWSLPEAGQVTIEPQLISTHDSALPQVSFHYAVVYTDAGIVILNESEALLRQYALGCV